MILEKVKRRFQPWKRHLAYGRYVWNHKVNVFKAGRPLSLPFWILLLHDWDKFLPDEWFAYAETFYHPDGSKKDYDPASSETEPFLRAWSKHQKRNKHHWQYWLRLSSHIPLRHFPNVLVMDRGDYLTVGGNKIPHERFTADEMPHRYVREMLADWASFGNPKAWYEKTKDQKILHPKTRAFLEELLHVHYA